MRVPKRGTRQTTHRLNKIYTRTGDEGLTGLGDGSRVAKDSLRVNAYGTVDEANSCIGMVLACEIPEAVRTLLTRVQHQLFDLGGELCVPGMSLIHQIDIDRLEQDLDGFNADLPPLKDFILPSGGMASASCHVARTVTRRAEREVVTLAKRSGASRELAFQSLNDVIVQGGWRAALNVFVQRRFIYPGFPLEPVLSLSENTKLF